MKLAREVRFLFLACLFEFCFLPLSANSAEGCGQVKVRAGDSCEFLDVVVDLVGCGESATNKVAKVVCASDGTGEVIYDSSKASYHARLKKDSTGWVVVEPLAKFTAASPEKIIQKKKKKGVEKASAERAAPTSILTEVKMEPVVALVLPSPVISPSPVPTLIPAPSALNGVMGKGAVTLGGSVRFRGEGKDNLDFLESSSDMARFALMKFRMDFGFKPRSDLSVFIQPQASRVFGKNEVVSTSTNAGVVTSTSTGTSGGTQDGRMDLHQGYLSYRPSENIEFTVGRQILSYGDELLIGALEWNNIGRAFDALKFSLRFTPGKIDLFGSKITERNDSGAGPGDKDLYGLYSSWLVADWLKQGDLYVLHTVDDSAAPIQRTTAAGVRLKSPVGSLDYRGEYTFENFRGAVENQIDFELGYTLFAEKKVRLSVEYFRASQAFDQLFPTGHKWLGYADYFSRKNIQGYHFGLSSDLFSGISMTVDYHLFSRTKTDTAAYNLSGVSYGSVGDDLALADELDVVFKGKLNELLTLSAGGAWIKPQAYMLANKGSDSGYFYYTELSAVF